MSPPTPAARGAPRTGMLPGHELDALLGARHHDPFAVLGPHHDGDGLLVRACLPGAVAAQLAGAGQFGCRMEPGRTVSSSITRSAPALSILCEPSPSR